MSVEACAVRLGRRLADCGCCYLVDLVAFDGMMALAAAGGDILYDDETV